MLVSGNLPLHSLTRTDSSLSALRIFFHRHAHNADFSGFAGATRAADNGATIHQLMALYGWKTEKMALVYTRKADRKRLATSAAHLLLPAQRSNENLPHLESGAGTVPKFERESGG
jgi:hypothetical protein